MDSLFPLMLILTVVTIYAIYRIFKSPDLSSGQPDEVLHGQIAIALSLSDNASEEGTVTTATPEMVDQLRAKSISLDRTLTMDEATHLLNLFSPPSGRQIDILKHFRIPHSQGMSRTMADYHIRRIFENPDNVESWNRRPPTARLQQALLFMSGGLVNGLTYVEAQSMLTRLGMDNPMKYQEWKRMERHYFEANSPSLLGKYSARKITWKYFFECYQALIAEGVHADDINGEAILMCAKRAAVTAGQSVPKADSQVLQAEGQSAVAHAL